MALKGYWGVQVHMPFTGGTYFSRRLRSTGDKGNRFGGMHDLPMTEWRHEREFMTVRQIPEWYRSAHGYMSPNWRCGGTESHMWNIINARLVHCKDDNFDKFMHNVFQYYPGLASWAYGMYAVPGMEFIHLDDVDDWLLRNFAIEYDPDAPINTHKDPKVGISNQIREMCRFMEDPHWWLLTRSKGYKK